jgi:glycosyltransferase involved in cell wall biosynthesis
MDVAPRTWSDGAVLSVLVWCPMLSPGGGLRLILSLTPAIARDPRIGSVRLAVPEDALDAPTAERLLAAGVTVAEIAVHGPATLHRAGGRVVRVSAPVAWLRDAAREAAEGADVVYAPWPHTDPAPELEIPVVCTYQDTTLLDFPEYLTLPLWRQEVWFTEGWLRRSTVETSSHTVARDLRRRIGPLVQEDLPVIDQAVPPTPPTSLAPAGLPDALPDRYVLFAGNVGVHKNLDTVLTAWARFEHRREWPLVVVGQATVCLRGPPADHWRTLQLAGLVERLGLGPGDGLHALGYVSDGSLARLMAGAAGLIMASHAEGGCFPVAEALDAGVPVLCSDIPVMREHLAGRTAEPTWFDPASVDSVLAAVRSFTRRHAALAASARAGRADARPTWDDVAGAYATLFARVAAVRGSACAP